VLLEDRVDMDPVAFNKFPDGEVPSDGAAHPTRVGPCPVRALIRISESQRDLIDHMVDTAAIGERQHGDLRRHRFVIGSVFAVSLRATAEANGPKMNAAAKSLE